jgi:predicted esterase
MRFCLGWEKVRELETHVDESGRPQEQVVFLHGLGMNNAKVAANVTVAEICALELPVLFVREIGH